MEFYQMPMFNKVLVKDIEKAENGMKKHLVLKVFLNLEMIKMKC